MASDPVKILAIDDSEDDRLLYKRCLKKAVDINYALAEAATGEEGLARIDKETFACVLLDYSLPGRNGVEILKRIRAKHPYVPVVMLTGQGNEKVAVAAMQEGAQNYIAKASIDPQSLAHMIDGAIRHCAMQNRIAEQRSSLEVFARALAHDLKEPVRSIRTLLDLVSAETSLSAQANHHFQAIRHAAERLTGLIDTVYFYTQLDTSAPADPDVCEASKLVDAAKANMSELIRERQAVISYPPLPRVSVNREQIVQVFQSLMTNAIQHGSTTPRVDISVTEATDHWRFQVSDNGPGIRKEDVENLFKPFKRLSRYGRQGPGLGLAICAKILELHGGKIWHEPASGRGANFLFTLPKVQAGDAESASQTSESTARAGSAGESREIATLLLVDDNDIDIELAQRLLIDGNRLRCKVLVAQDGQEALAILRDATVDLVLLDINMPRMDGFELLQRMRAEQLLQRVSVIMCSTSTYERDMAKAKELGARGYLTKPPNFGKFKLIVEQSTPLEIIHEGSGGRVLLCAA